MADTRAGAARPRWPYQGRPQVLLPLAGLAMTIGAFLPWLDTAFGPTYLGQVEQLWVLSAGAIALAGAVWRSRVVVMTHAAFITVIGIGLSVWRLGVAYSQLPAFGEAWVPGPGALLVLASGAVAAFSLGWLARAGTARNDGPSVRADR